MAGSIPNVMKFEKSETKINKLLKNLIQITGLDLKKEYLTKKDRKSLHYRKWALLMDRDEYGNEIIGKLINFIQYYWPALLRVQFLNILISPYTRVEVNCGNMKYFYSEEEISDWKINNGKPDLYEKYFTNIGKFSARDVENVFQNLKQKVIPFVTEKSDSKLIESLFEMNNIDNKNNLILLYLKKTLFL